MFKTLFGSRTKSATKAFENISVAQLKAQIEAGESPMLIDVRSAEEFASGHIAGARLLPLGTIPARHGELPQNRPMIITCRSGARSRMACEQLHKLGYTELQNLSGGLLAWQKAGFATVR